MAGSALLTTINMIQTIELKHTCGKHVGPDRVYKVTHYKVILTGAEYRVTEWA